MSNYIKEGSLESPEVTMADNNIELWIDVYELVAELTLAIRILNLFHLLF